MKKKSKRTLTPKLRFPEFRDAPGWEAQPLDSVSQFVKKKIPLHQLNLDAYVSTENLSPDYGGIEQASKLPPNGSATEYKPDDILIANIRPYLKKVWRSNRSGGASNDVIVIRANAVLRKDYLPMVIANDAFINYVMKTAKGVKMPRGDIASMKEYIVHYPAPPEQQKIADCLSSLDGLIAAEGRTLEALKTHKNGLMRQLFPQPGETKPRLRFPEFQNAKSGFKLVGTIAKVTTGNKDTQNKVDDGEYPFFVRSQNVERIDSFAQDCEAVLTSGDGVGVGENYHYINGKFDFHQRVYCIYDFNQSVSGKFFFHYFSTHFKKRVKEMSAKNSVDSVRMAMITEMPIWMPPPAEQKRIAACLTALDTRITAQAAKVESLKQHKRGLMQQIFPAPEEQ